ncbi:hypothetical protein [Streptomyces sp. NPDC059349]|uniref:hypothetical protein n=1 Tax=Streptomyces sp. NPDC059349 TaxID=3346808 RepID=UPI0036B0E282
MASASVRSGDFFLSPGEADFESFDLAEPALALGLGNASDEVVSDLFESRTMGRIWSEE